MGRRRPRARRQARLPDAIEQGRRARRSPAGGRARPPRRRRRGRPGTAAARSSLRGRSLRRRAATLPAWSGDVRSTWRAAPAWMTITLTRGRRRRAARARRAGALRPPRRACAPPVRGGPFDGLGATLAPRPSDSGGHPPAATWERGRRTAGRALRSARILRDEADGHRSRDDDDGERRAGPVGGALAAREAGETDGADLDRRHRRSGAVRTAAAATTTRTASGAARREASGRTTSTIVEQQSRVRVSSRVKRPSTTRATTGARA